MDVWPVVGQFHLLAPDWRRIVGMIELKSLGLQRGTSGEKIAVLRPVPNLDGSCMLSPRAQLNTLICSTPS